MSDDRLAELRPVVALVPVRDGASTIVATVRALRSLSSIDRVVVIDDGSLDGTADLVVDLDDELTTVLRIERNLGKGGAIAAGVAATYDATTYVLIDADLGSTASEAAVLLEALVEDCADLVIGRPNEEPGVSGGLGIVRTMASAGIRRGCGFETLTPLCGQRAIRASLLRSISMADRFGIETGMTIDAVRNGARVIEVSMAFTHRSTGRSVAGFAHRGRQGADIVRALWSRLTSARLRIVVCSSAAALLLLVAIVGSFWFEPPSEVIQVDGPRKVVLFGFPRLALSDLGKGDTPHLDAIAASGAFGVTSVRTLSGRPATVEAYASIGAGARIKAGSTAADAYGSDENVGLRTAAEVAESRTGRAVSGQLVVPAIAQTLLANAHRFVPSDAGALGDTLHKVGMHTAVVGTSDVGNVAQDSNAGLARPAVVALADSAGSVDFGTVGHELLVRDPFAPSGVRADRAQFRRSAAVAIALADVTVLDPGEMDRVFASKTEVASSQFEVLRRRAIRRTDEILGDVALGAPSGTLLIVTSVRPPTGTWELTPTVISGAGVVRGYLSSPSTRRPGLITITDLTPTILAAVGVKPPAGMIGHALRVRTSSTVNLSRFRDLNKVASYRERLYLPLSKGYVLVQALVYLLVILLFSTRSGVGRSRAALEWTVLAIAAFPLATFAFRAVPDAWILGPLGGAVVLGIDLAMVSWARRCRRHALSPLAWILFTTLAVITLDVSTGARLQQASILGYSPHTAARFTGIGNAAFAVLAVCTVLWAAIHVHYSPRRGEALFSATLVCVVVLVVDGAPMLGADVGGIVTLAPVFGLLLFVLSGRRLGVRAVATSGAVMVALLALATGLDLARPAKERSHLGRFVSNLGRDNSTLTRTIGRKLSTNVRVSTGSFWTWVVPIIAITLLFFLVVEHGWERDIPPGTALRVGVVASILAGLVGFAVNDSGSVVTALVFVEIGPFITLLALGRQDVPRILTRDPSEGHTP